MKRSGSAALAARSITERANRPMLVPLLPGPSAGGALSGEAVSAALMPRLANARGASAPATPLQLGPVAVEAKARQPQIQLGDLCPVLPFLTLLAPKKASFLLSTAAAGIGSGH